MNKFLLLGSIVSFSLISLANAKVVEAQTKNIENAIKTLRGDMHFLDQLFEKIYNTDIVVNKIGAFESRAFLAEGIASYIDSISGGGPKKFVLVHKEDTKQTIYKMDMDLNIYKNWYKWSVQNLCKRLVDTLEPIVSDENLIDMEIINKMKGCRNILDGDLEENSYEMMKLLHVQPLEVIKLS